MSRTIRRPYAHLLNWWIDNLGPVTTSKDDWRQRRTPRLLYSKKEPQIIRRVQSDVHRFFAREGSYARKRFQKQFRQLTRMNIHAHVRADCWDDFVNKTRYYEPYT